MSNLPLLEDACAALPHATRSMFGGHGLFAPNGAMFAAVVDLDRIALKLVEPADQEAFRAAGGEPWVYDGRASMGAWFVIPDEMYDDPHALSEWTRRAHATVKPTRKKPASKKSASKKSSKKAPAKRARKGGA